MAIDDLLTLLERKGVDTLDTPRNLAEVSAKPASTDACTLATPDTSRKVNPENNDGETCKHDGKTSIWWRFRYRDGTPKEAAFCPAVTHAEALAGEPEAITAQSFEPIPRQPNTPFSEQDEALIRVWLAGINETDEEIIAGVIDQCRYDADARAGFIHLALQQL